MREPEALEALTVAAERGEMAQQGNQAERVKFCCPICLDLLRDPVTIACGHNYCMKCITTFWDGDDQKEINSCPQCRKTFTPRPDLVKNTLLADLVEELKKTGLKTAPVDHRYVGPECYAGPEDVPCDFCTGKKRKALKSCLVCLASYCEQHLQPHYDSPAFKRHKLVEASVKLQETVCPRHDDEVIKIFCRTDQQCICILCSMAEHKGHDTVSAAAERLEKQKELGASRQKIRLRIQEREKDATELQQQLDAINRYADTAVEDGERRFNELICDIQKRSSDVTQQIRYHQETEANQVRELQEKLQQEIAELKRENAEMKKLSRTEDHTEFLHKYISLSGSVGEASGSPRNNINRLWYFQDATAAVTAVRDKLQAVLGEKWPRAELTTRDEFLQHSRRITLDPNTANNLLVLSEGNRKITYNVKNNPYPPHPERFVYTSQILSKDQLTGHCYWEVKKSGSVGVAVAYVDIGRSGDFDERVFGHNEKSWVLHCSESYVFIHNKISAAVSGRQSSRIGVYLNHSAGILSFYSVSDTMTLLHRVKTTFTQPLYAGLFLFSDRDTAELCEFK